jgi:hypothetical protein
MAAAPSTEPIARVLSPVLVAVDGEAYAVFYNGLAPTLAGLYQLNVQLPADLLPGTHSLAIQTLEAFTGMANIVIGPQPAPSRSRFGAAANAPTTTEPRASARGRYITKT